MHPGGGTNQDAAVDPPQIPEAYPDPNRFGVIPAYGFFFRNAKGIVMRDVEVRTVQPDLRPAFFLDSVESADFSHIRLPSSTPLALGFRNVKDFNLTLSRPLPDTYLENVTQKTM